MWYRNFPAISRHFPQFFGNFSQLDLTPPPPPRPQSPEQSQHPARLDWHHCIWCLGTRAHVLLLLKSRPLACAVHCARVPCRALADLQRLGALDASNPTPRLKEGHQDCTLPPPPRVCPRLIYYATTHKSVMAVKVLTNAGYPPGAWPVPVSFRTSGQSFASQVSISCGGQGGG